MIAAHLEVVEQDPKPVEALLSMNTAVETALIEHRREFQRNLDRRIGNESAAEDVFQIFCLRALTSGRELRDNERVVAWLFSVLRSVLADHYWSEVDRRSSGEKPSVVVKHRGTLRSFDLQACYRAKTGRRGDSLSLRLMRT